MTQIIKRLEIIKNSILIEDIEIIELQIIKLNSLNIDDNIKSIIEKLENSEYSLALSLIENYISKYSGLIVYEDKELVSLKFALKQLEIKLQELIEQKTEYINNIEEFNKEYNLRLGELIKTILSLRKEILYKKTIQQKKEKLKYQEDIKTYDETKEIIEELKDTIEDLEYTLNHIDEDFEKYDEIKQAYDELRAELKRVEEELKEQEERLEKIKEFIEDESIKDEFEEAKSFYENFEDEFEDIKEKQKDIIELNEEDKKELKNLFRKAAKLCHPDIVADEHREKAHQIMQELNEAYSKQDLNKVRTILNSLESGFGFETTSDSIDDKELLKIKIIEFEESIRELKTEIEAIKEDDTYQVVSEIENWDEYFEELKSELEKEKIKLENEINEVLEEDIEEWIQKLWNWADEKKISNDLLSRKKENLLAKTTIDFTGLKLKEIPKELFYLENITTLILWDNDIRYLPEEIVNFTNLKKLNLRGNPKLAISVKQKEWLDGLKGKCEILKDDIRMIGEKSEKESEFVYTSKKSNTDFVKEDKTAKKDSNYWESEF